MCPNSKKTCGGACGSPNTTQCPDSAFRGKQRASSSGDIEDLPEALKDDLSFPAKRKQRAYSSGDIDDIPEALVEVASRRASFGTSHSGLHTKPRKRAKHTEGIEGLQNKKNQTESDPALPRLKLGRYCCVPLKFSEPVFFADEESNWDLGIFVDTPNESENESLKPSEEKNNMVDRNSDSLNVSAAEGGVDIFSLLTSGDYEGNDSGVVDHGTPDRENEGSDHVLGQGGTEDQRMVEPDASSPSVVGVGNELETPSQLIPLQEAWLRHREG